LAASVRQEAWNAGQAWRRSSWRQPGSASKLTGVNSGAGGTGSVGTLTGPTGGGIFTGGWG
jgi:hypothetical protein